MSENEPESTGPRYGRVRRAPRYGSFVASGAIGGIVVGVILGVVQAMRNSESGQFTANTVVGYVVAILGLLGALLGGGLAVFFDRRRGGRGREAE